MELQVSGVVIVKQAYPESPIPPEESQFAQCVAVPAAAAVTTFASVPVRFNPSMITPLLVIGLPLTVSWVAVLLETPTEVTADILLVQALPTDKHTAPVPDTPLLRLEADRATPPTWKPLVALIVVPVIALKLFVAPVKLFAAFSFARFVVSERLADANATPFTVNALVAFHTGAVCVVPVNVFDAFNFARFAVSDSADELICVPLIS